MPDQPWATTPPALPAPLAESGWRAFLAAKIAADPRHAPEQLALSAVRRWGPWADDWVARTRQRYPSATPDGLARLAAVELARTARRQAAATAVAGPAGTSAAALWLAQTQVRLVLAVAAGYGLDPTSEDRAPELLRLLRVPRATEPALTALGQAGRMVTALVVRRLAARLVPFGAALVTAVAGAQGLEDLAGRAAHHYARGAGLRPVRGS
ncbi:MAG TPA: hypothetical protein VF163_10525 [Micromonosporaceae bacterium]